MPHPVHQRLLASPLFDQVEPQRAQAFLESAELRPFKRRELIFHEGDRVEGLYLLAEGRVKLTQVTSSGDEVILRLLAPGDVFAGLAALPGPDRYPVNAYGLTDGVAAFWPRGSARRQVQGDAGLLQGILRAVSGQVQDVHVRLRDLSAERVPVRLAAVLDRLALDAGRPAEGGGTVIDFPLTRQEVAEMTGTTLYTVSRVLTEWAGEGWIALGREQITVLDPAALRRLVGG